MIVFHFCLGGYQVHSEQDQPCLRHIYQTFNELYGIRVCINIIFTLSTLKNRTLMRFKVYNSLSHKKFNYFHFELFLMVYEIIVHHLVSLILCKHNKNDVRQQFLKKTSQDFYKRMPDRKTHCKEFSIGGEV